MTLTPRERATLAAICRAIVPAIDLPLVDLIDDGLTDTPEHLRARFRILLRSLGSPAVARTQPPRPLAIRRLMRRLRHTAALIVLVRDRGSGTVRGLEEMAKIHLAAGASEVFSLHTRGIHVDRGEPDAAGRFSHAPHRVPDPVGARPARSRSPRGAAARHRRGCTLGLRRRLRSADRLPAPPAASARDRPAWSPGVPRGATAVPK